MSPIAEILLNTFNLIDFVFSVLETLSFINRVEWAGLLQIRF